MAGAERSVRQSVSIPTGIAKRVRTLAKSRKTSANRVLVDLIEAGLQSKEAEKERFLSLVKRLTESRDAAERQRVKSLPMGSPSQDRDAGSNPAGATSSVLLVFAAKACRSSLRRGWKPLRSAHAGPA